ncbi:hypothetical protein EKO04_010604 [Ascochyta lentis]|uniref:Uncharacterized protein n=1 Tax=Ascochyta lentis TaxID=205686 RepID=A0A8H7MDU4_9PLEO|nr:hypothetical protein EKO04_010604 [Ascochyta lentis]
MSRHSTADNVSTLISNLRINKVDDEQAELSNDTQKASSAGTANGTVVALQFRSILWQGRSPLLNLPGELRLQVCSHMALSPVTLDWTGAFFSCRQLHHDMVQQLPPVTEMEECLQHIVATQPESSDVLPCELIPGLPHPLFSWVRHVALKLYVPNGWKPMMPRLYALHLDNLQILLVSDKDARHTSRSIPLPYGDLKTLRPPYLWNHKAKITMNCKKITLILYELAKADGARAKETSYNLTLPGTEIVYLFTIVQNKEEKQIQRSYTFNSRFKLPVM